MGAKASGNLRAFYLGGVYLASALGQEQLHSWSKPSSIFSLPEAAVEGGYPWHPIPTPSKSLQTGDGLQLSVPENKQKGRRRNGDSRGQYLFSGGHNRPLWRPGCLSAGCPVPLRGMPWEPQTALARAPVGEGITEAFWESAWPLRKYSALHCLGNLPAVVL